MTKDSPPFDAQLRSWLQDMAQDPSQLDADQELKTLITKIYRGARKHRRSTKRLADHQQDRSSREQTGRCREEIDGRQQGPQRDTSSTTEHRQMLQREQSCYVCKQSYRELDHYYHLLCPTCAADHHRRRSARCNLSGRMAVVTGGRIKVGYALCLKLLRDGARVVMTTRFPVNALARFRAEQDADEWIDRLQVLQLDLRQLGAVQACIKEIAAIGPIDILVNNAAQTISRPPSYYHDLLQAERTGLPHSDPNIISCSTDKLVQLQASDVVPDFGLFPSGLMAADGQQLDLRNENSWSMELEDVPPVELLEVHLVNVFAPFLLIQGLLPLMERSPHPDRFIINVSAMEGQFARNNKTSRHVHTNMAKAGLNMITRTCASWLQERHIHMNSVDTGWITQEHPYPVRQRVRAHGFVPPLDEIDGAARIYAPIIDGINGQAAYGQFFKDYRSYPW